MNSARLTAAGNIHSKSSYGRNTHLEEIFPLEPGSISRERQLHCSLLPSDPAPCRYAWEKQQQVAGTAGPASPELCWLWRALAGTALDAAAPCRENQPTEVLCVSAFLCLSISFCNFDFQEINNSFKKIRDLIIYIHKQTNKKEHPRPAHRVSLSWDILEVVMKSFNYEK